MEYKGQGFMIHSREIPVFMKYLSKKFPDTTSISDINLKEELMDLRKQGTLAFSGSLRVPAYLRHETKLIK